ncbi:AsnC family transcriptional regulator [Tenacibaculum sp. Bg11-29]|uniref:Lrp/AsnC family transcriptional regulator n=1 Tax=Tenacibaculum sp. Bg11-29 TaxID=2058306 RepID=UPI000C3387B5|nr:Lrp/AsnC family transcriptional regulator [Tenacibaculum sp. Bg11-29]PKH50910.1 AsnC family transcriptional regulator [Tenacibaculum sp. Bg11-29]
MEKLDKFDLDILTIIQKDNSIIQRDIGKSVNLSAAAVQRRIKKMTVSGVIQSNIAVIDPLKLGKFITLFVEVELESEKIELIDEAKKKFKNFLEVQQCYYVTGKADFVLIIVVPTMADYEKLTRALFFEDNNIKRFETFVGMDRVKVGLDVQL